MKRKVLYIFVLFVSLNCFASPSHQPTFVLVHGALLTSNSWAAVQSYLQNKGFSVITIDMPGRVKDNIATQQATLSAAVEKICKVINAQSNNVILVAHSQAGATITQAFHNCGAHVNALVYVAAVVPLSGEKPFDLLSASDYENFDYVAPIDNVTGTSVPNLQGPIKKYFMNDATELDAKQAINNMVAEPIIFAESVLAYDQQKFNSVAKYYIKTKQDLIISPPTQNKYLSRTKMNGIFELDTSHSPFISQPHLLAQHLISINEMLGNKR